MNLKVEPPVGLAKRHLQLCQSYVQEVDANRRLYWQSQILEVEEQLKAYARSEATMALLHVLQPYVARSTVTTSSEQASILRTWRFLESLYQPVLRSNVPEPEPLPEDLEELIGVLRDLREIRRRQAMANILAHGPAAILPLERALSQYSSPLVQARIIYTLAMLGEVRLLRPVWRAHQESITSEVTELLEQALLRMSQTLEATPDKLPLTDLLDIFIFSRSLMPLLADSLARALARLAAIAPTLELRATLPYLQSSWLRPLSSAQREARMAIDTATRNLAELPLPASATQQTESLPRPTESLAVLESLPRPTIESSDGG
ncbi:MAG: hypothetical protein QM758_28030 [Armatimonas sp.]